MFVFVEGGKPENLEKNSQKKLRTNYKLTCGTRPVSNLGHIGGK